MRRGFDEAYAKALMEGISEESEGELNILGFIVREYMRVIEIYFLADDYVIRYDVAFNSGYNLDQYIEQIINNVKRNHNTITYVRG